MNKPGLVGIATAVSASLLLAGCAGSPAASSEGAGGTAVTIGVMPGADLAPLYLGVEEGFFADEGIDLTINSLAASSTAILGAVDSGKYDFGYGDAVSILVALEGGSEIEIISGAAASSGDTAFDYAALIVRADSDIASTADLQHRSVSTDALFSTNELVLRSAIDTAGAGSATVAWHEIPFIDATRAVADGEVDAALVVEPFATAARLEGMRVISYPYAAFNPQLTVSAYYASSATVAGNPDLVERFRAALDKSLEFAAGDIPAVRENISTYMESGAAVRSRLALPVFGTEIDRAAADQLAAAAVKYRLLSVAPNLDEILP